MFKGFCVLAVVFSAAISGAVDNVELKTGESVLMGTYRISCEGSAAPAPVQKFYRCTTSAFSTISGTLGAGRVNSPV